jgi:UDP-N-acetylmuramyl pentapeptide phosphotransferase/UDP-N-acetylglucosamine-1-phosphate transferase
VTGRGLIRSPRLAGAISAAGVGGAWWWLRQLPPEHSQPWTRSNFRGREVTLLLGPAVAAGSLAGLVAAAPAPRRTAVAAVAAAAAVGAYDDRYGDSHARGLGGHLQALREGRITTGQVKLAVLVATAAVTSSWEGRTKADIVLDTVLVAGGANLANLLDLRPGRAAKVCALAGTLLARTGDRAARPVAAVAAGAALSALPADLREHGMLGDCGAAVLGATLGRALVGRRSRWSRLLAAATVTGATIASERVSFGAVIDAHPVLRRLDRFGRAG